MTYAREINIIFSISEPIFQTLQTGLTIVRIGHYPFHQPSQIRPTHIHRHAVTGDRDGHPECASVQSFRIDDHTSRLIVKQLDAISAFVHEDVHVTVHRVISNPVPDKSGEGVEALAHIGRLAIEPIPHLLSQTKHCRRMLQ